MRFPDNYNQPSLSDLFENKKNNVSYFSLVEFGNNSYDINYHFGKNFEGHYWILIMKGKIVDFETKENNNIFINAMPAGLMSEPLHDILMSLDTKKCLEISDIIFS